MSFRKLIDRYGLEPNPHGGWFRQTYVAESPQGGRGLASIIYYLLTAEGPSCTPHRTSADCLHYFHQGSALTVLSITPGGSIERSLLGSDLEAGHQLQVLVPGVHWKGFLLEQGDYCLISEAVVPSYSPDDDELADPEKLRARFPEAWAELAPFFPATQ